MHRTTVWTNERHQPIQVSVACLDAEWEPHAEVTLEVGPFDSLDAIRQQAVDQAHALGGWRAHQGALFT